MADIDDRHPFIAQAQNQFKQAMRFPRGEGGGGFIHHQNAAVAVQRASNFYLLLFGDGELHHPIGGAELCAEAVNHRLRLGGHLLALHHPAARQLAAEEDIFGYGQIGRELHLLINQSDACGQRIFRPFNVKRLAVDQDLAAGRGIGPREDFHQRAFSRAVFAHQRMDLTGKHRQIHALERVETAKRFGNAAHL